ncbi:MAG: Fic family protein [Thiofilum sp.]|uniref:Fic family protein n=1 Tax=Thiofilum sp. TaxID=2212733 RepID=UPI0025FDD44F|nr:Fic family protein [Thiofilum sp.]MBK8452152.1 Fic family protein [Thiofilum sp.]
MKTHSLEIAPDILRIITEIDEFKTSWRLMQNLAPERLATLRRVATIESIGSSTRIEGVKLSNSEIEQLLGNINRKSFVTRDEQEVAGYAELMDIIFQSYDDIVLSENYIKQLHAILLQYSDKDERHRGQYKTLNNQVEAFDATGKSLGVVFHTATPFETPLKMQELVYWTRESLADNSLHPLLVIAVFVVVFLQIHPFQDGNGRLSRILTTLLLLKAGYRYVPYSSLESIIERNKEGYYLALRRTQSTLEDAKPNWLPWVRFFLSSLKAQKDHLSSKVSAHTSWDNLPKESIMIMEHINQYGRITTSEAEALTATPRSTIKKRLSDLVEQGLLKRQGQGRGSWYETAKQNL